MLKLSRGPQTAIQLPQTNQVLHTKMRDFVFPLFPFKCMELEFEEGGSNLPLEIGSEIQIGRELGLGFGPSSADRTISRRHLSLRPIDDPIEKFRVGFKVLGKNPILVCGGTDGGRRIYKSSEKGELRVGDKFSLSLKEPSFCVVRRREGENGEDEERRRVLDAVERREKRTLERRREREERAKEGVFEGEDDEEFGTFDVSQIDPVKGKIRRFPLYLSNFLFICAHILSFFVNKSLQF